MVPRARTRRRPGGGRRRTGGKNGARSEDMCAQRHGHSHRLAHACNVIVREPSIAIASHNVKSGRGGEGGRGRKAEEEGGGRGKRSAETGYSCIRRRLPRDPKAGAKLQSEIDRSLKSEDSGSSGKERRGRSAKTSTHHGTCARMPSDYFHSDLMKSRTVGLRPTRIALATVGYIHRRRTQSSKDHVIPL